jgi:hypothetical protein
VTAPASPRGAVPSGLSRRLAGLFLLALLGTLFALGLVVADVGGGVAVAVYALAVTALVVAGAVTGKRRAAARVAPARPAGERCACCAGDHTAPVQVIE